MDTTHTPGPWLINLDEALIYVEGEEEDTCICDLMGKGTNHTSHKQAIANAKLITAAPDLLEAATKALALLDSVAFVSESGDTDDIVKQLSQAIAKVTRGSSRGGF